MEQFSEACSEMDFILNNMNENFLSKIPYKLKDFFKNNKSKTYKVKIDLSKNLYEQNLLEETEIFLQIIYKLFIANKTEKEKYIAESRKLFVEKNAAKWLSKNKKDGSENNG